MHHFNFFQIFELVRLWERKLFTFRGIHFEPSFPFLSPSIKNKFRRVLKEPFDLIPHIATYCGKGFRKFQFSFFFCMYGSLPYIQCKMMPPILCKGIHRRRGLTKLRDRPFSSKLYVADGQTHFPWVHQISLGSV